MLIVAAYAVALLGWAWFVTTVDPPWLSFDRPGGRPAALGAAIGGAIALHGALVLAILRWGRGGGRSAAVASGVLIVASLAHLIVSAVVGEYQDYYLYLDIWREILAGRDPWFLVVGGPRGSYSLHAYGPLYNLLALPTLWHPLGPKLLFAGAYWAFVAWLSLTAPSRGMPRWSAPAMAAWFAGPFTWVEIAVFGHFDVLVALLCVGAVDAVARGRWGASAVWIASGVLLKYIPGILAPFLALDRGKVRWRWLAATAGLSLAGLGVAWAIWGPSVLRPILLATSRESAGLSFFRYLRGMHSPVSGEDLFFRTDEYAGPALLLGLCLAWRRARQARLEPAASGVLGLVVTLALYKVGFPQYFMVPYLLAPYWFAREYATLPRRGWLVATYLAAFAWISWFNILMAANRHIWVEHWAGLVTLPLMLALAAAIAVAGRDQSLAEVSRPTPGPESRRA